MWARVEAELANLLTVKRYSSLNGSELHLEKRAERARLLLPAELKDVRAYDDLFFAGKAHIAKCRAFSHFIVVQIKELQGGEEAQGGIRKVGFRTAPKAELWSKPLYRGVGSNFPYGNWWFDEELLQRWKNRYPTGTPNRKQQIMDGMRPMLALPESFNGFVELYRMVPSEPIPVITGEGKHIPTNKPNPDEKDKEERKRQNELYKATNNVLFMGGYKQFYVPIVKRNTIALYVL